MSRAIATGNGAPVARCRRYKASTTISRQWGGSAASADLAISGPRRLGSAAAAAVRDPAVSRWPHIVQTLRYINDYVIPAVGPVEPVSGYRNPVAQRLCRAALRKAPTSIIPRSTWCRCDRQPRAVDAHAVQGPRAPRPRLPVGLGFYAFLRFHVDTTKYRRWGPTPNDASCPPIIRPVDLSSVYQPPAASSPAGATAPLTVYAPPAGAVDPLAPAPDRSPPAAATPPPVGGSRPQP